MPVYKIINLTKNRVVVNKAFVADTFFKRLKGLIFKKTLDGDEGLIFYHTSSIHTFFMRFAIDVVFLNRNLEVVKIYHSFKPFRLAFCWGAFLVLELSSEKCKETFTERGDKLNLIEQSTF